MILIRSWVLSRLASLSASLFPGFWEWPFTLIILIVRFLLEILLCKIFHNGQFVHCRSFQLDWYGLLVMLLVNPSNVDWLSVWIIMFWCGVISSVMDAIANNSILVVDKMSVTEKENLVCGGHIVHPEPAVTDSLLVFLIDPSE